MDNLILQFKKNFEICLVYFYELKKKPKYIFKNILQTPSKQHFFNECRLSVEIKF